MKRPKIRVTWNTARTALFAVSLGICVAAFGASTELASN